VSRRAPIRGLLLDAGGVLYRPIGGRWNPRFDFERVLAAFDPAHDPARDPARFAAAVAAGDAFLDASPATAPRDDYHRAVLAALGIADPAAALLEALDRPLPLDVPHLELFPEVERVLAEVQRRGIPMAIVSDNWGTGAQMLAGAFELGRYIQLAVVSQEIGYNKPDPRIFAAASDGIGVPPEACLFVDDSPELVQAAVALGYQGLAMGRSVLHPPADVLWIDSLDEVLAWLPPAV
jgi:FMN phosphatase YigB (HAD superfamily)